MPWQRYKSMSGSLGRDAGPGGEGLRMPVWKAHIRARAVHSCRASAAFLVLLALAACLPKEVSAGQSAPLTPQAQSLFRAGAASLNSGDFQGAITAYQKFLELNKQYGPAYLNLGLAYHSLNQYEQAIPSFTKALELDDHLESAALFLGIDYCKTGLPEKATEP